MTNVPMLIEELDSSVTQLAKRPSSYSRPSSALKRTASSYQIELFPCTMPDFAVGEYVGYNVKVRFLLLERFANSMTCFILAA